MNEVDSESQQGASADDAPDTSSAPKACDYDLADRENLDALWLEFQRERSAFCPVTGAKLDLALSHDPLEDRSSVAEVLIACGRCGRRESFAPPDAKEIFGWAE